MTSRSPVQSWVTSQSGYDSRGRHGRSTTTTTITWTCPSSSPSDAVGDLTQRSRLEGGLCVYWGGTGQRGSYTRTLKERDEADRHKAPTAAGMDGLLAGGDGRRARQDITKQLSPRSCPRMGIEGLAKAGPTG
uniref:Uncharacterized protein n=1 Tax=Eutreptiella gymnastica TaxID=73025 RepID=A0A7S1N317_9EUGL|mmetsp:Transcript_111677/g.193827  ORF Transcript_111677/g.193827 Transcript_111677/m.193827 type:complete len:133 (+) Transcript_111677:152-550(+)